MTARFMPLATAAVLAAVATQAGAQQAPAAAAPTPNPTAAAFKALQERPPGPVVSGLCVLSREGIIARSTVGAYAAREMERIEQAVNTELTTARTAAETNIRSLDSQAQAGTLPRESAGAQANQIAANLQNLVNLRVAEIRETDNRVQAKIMSDATPLILESITAKRCSALFDQSALIYSGDAYDITPDVVTRLNAKVTSFPIERVQAAPPNQAGAAAGGPPPVATTPAPAGRGGAAAAPGRGAQGPSR